MAVVLKVHLVTCILENNWNWVGVLAARNCNDTHPPPFGKVRPSLAIQSLRNVFSLQHDR